jgi:hypothetical protein
MKKQSLFRSAADYVSVRLGLAVLLAVPLAVAPSQNEVPAQAVIPDSVAFAQAGVVEAPIEWANRILVEDFNAPGDTTAQLRSSGGIDSPVGTFRGTGDVAIFNEQQWGGAPCSDCASTTTTATTTTTTTTDTIAIFSFYHPDPNQGGTRFSDDISTETGQFFLGDVFSIRVPTSEDFVNASVTSITITDGNTQTSYTASINFFNDFGNEVEFYVNSWDQYHFVRFDTSASLTLDVSTSTTETVTTFEDFITPSVDGRQNKFPSVGNGAITLTLARSTTYRYVGFWWSAGSPNNKICLLPATGSTCVAEYNTSDLLANASFNTEGVNWPAWQNGRPHYGNPRGRQYTGTTYCNGVTDSAGSQGIRYDGHCNEPFAFIHIFQDSGFRRVQFSGDAGTAFEFDNVTASTAESWELIDLLPAGTLIGASTLPAYSVTSPSVIPVDPRSESVSFPGVLLGGDAANEPNASLCVTEVDSGGAPVESGPSNLQISATVPAGVNSQTSAPRFVYSGARATIGDLSATIRINSATNSRNVVGAASKYLRISVQARTGTGLTTCSGTNNVVTAVIVELRPIRLNGSNIFGIPID